MQDFLICTTNGSYYSAFGAYRKIVEGAIWINFLKNNEFPKNGRVDNEISYSKHLDNFPNLKKYYKKSSDLIHSRERIYFNFLNENKEYHLEKFQTLVQNCYDELSNIYNSIFKIKWMRSNEVIKRFKRIYLPIERIRNDFNLIDYPANKEPGEKLLFGHEIYMEMINNNNTSWYKKEYSNDIELIISSISNRFINMIRKTEVSPYRIEENYIHSFMMLSEKCNDYSIMESAEIIIPYMMGGHMFYNFEEWLQLSYRDHKIKFKKEIDELSKLAIELLEPEQKKPFSNITISRLIIEDIICNILIAKPNSFIAFNTLLSNMQKENKSIKNINFIPNKHISPNKRPLQSTIDGKITGKLETEKENLNKIIKEIKRYLKTLKNKYN